MAFEILPKPPKDRASDNPWPQWPKIYRIDYGHEEANLQWKNDPRIYEISSKSFIDDENGNVSGINTVRVNWTKNDKGGWILNELPDTEEVFKVCNLQTKSFNFDNNFHFDSTRLIWFFLQWVSLDQNQAS